MSLMKRRTAHRHSGTPGLDRHDIARPFTSTFA